MDQVVRQELFGAQLLPLPKIFDGHLFTVPDYQRGYAWEEKQVVEMLTDIEHLLADGIALRHYTGTLVLSQPSTAASGEYHVVDGQQRLTTLSIILHALHRHLADSEKQMFRSRYLWRGNRASGRPVLRMNEETKQFFENRIVDRDKTVKPTMESHSRLLKAQQTIDKWMNALVADGAKVDVIRLTLESELGFLVYAPKETAETGIMFEVINNRGKPLSELEKVKNYLVYCCAKLAAPSLREFIDDSWTQILRDLNTAKKTTPADEGAFLRYCMAVHFKLGKTDSQYGYDELKKRIKLESVLKHKNVERNIRTVESFVKFLKAAAFWYARLYGRQYADAAPDLRRVLSQIRAQVRHASVMPLILALLIKSEGHGNALVRLLNLVEILNFRVYMAPHIIARNDSGQADLFRYAYQYYYDDLLRQVDWDLGTETAETEEEALEVFMVSFIYYHAPEARFRKSFQLEPGSVDDFYEWRGLRYFLMNYEQELQPNKTIEIDKITRSRKEGKSADYLSIEHIWATGYRCSEGENNRKKDSVERRRLGNFVLLELRLNIQGKVEGIKEKCGRYLDARRREPPTDLQQVREMGKDAKAALRKYRSRTRSKNYYLELYREINNRQEERFIAFAMNRWSIKQYRGYASASEEAVD